MKRIKVIILSLILALAIIPVQLNAGSERVLAPTEVESVRAQQLLNRLEEIKAMDKSTMNSSEKKEARKEVRSINKELKALNSGVYVSVGAILIVVLLLILLL